MDFCTLPHCSNTASKFVSSKRLLDRGVTGSIPPRSRCTPPFRTCFFMSDQKKLSLIMILGTMLIPYFQLPTQQNLWTTCGHRNRPNENAAYFPDIPSSLPFTRIYNDGDDGLTNDWRLREHWIPSSIWKNMKSSVPAVRHGLVFDQLSSA